MSDPRLAHKHDRVDEGGATFLAQRSCTFAQRRHPLSSRHRSPRSAEHSCGETQGKRALHGAPAVPLAAVPHRGTRPGLHKERRDQIVHPDAWLQGGDGVQVDRGQRVDGTAPQPRPMKRHW
jgi:hypothetical protein